MEKQYLDYAVEQIKILCNIPGPSGYTDKCVSYIGNLLSDMGFAPRVDRKNSILCDIGGVGEPLVIITHADSLGAMVRSIKGNGRLRLTKIGSYPYNSIEGENCVIHTRSGAEFTGTVQLCHSSAHVYPGNNDEKRDDRSLEVVIDERVKDRRDVKDLGIMTGDFISFDPRFVITESGYIKSRHLDDKAGVGITLALAKMAADKAVSLNRKVYLMFTSYEEIGHGAAAGIPEDAAEILSVDMGAVGDDLAGDEHKVSICAKDSMGPYDYKVTTNLINAAKKANLDFAVDIYPSYSSDAEAALYAGCNASHGLIGPGVASSHGYERTHIEGIENTLNLLTEYLKNTD